MVTVPNAVELSNMHWQEGLRVHAFQTPSLLWRLNDNYYAVHRLSGYGPRTVTAVQAHVSFSSSSRQQAKVMTEFLLSHAKLGMLS